MSKYSKGDKVRFKGDAVTYVVAYVNNDYSVDLEQATAGTPHIAYVPTRLLEPTPPEVKPGQVWKHKVSEARLLVMQPVEANSRLYHAASEVSTAASVFSPEQLNAHYELEHDV